MEKNIIKTIREAFSIAHINKLLKEDASALASNLTSDELRQAESLYKLWLGGREDLVYGKVDNKILNYLVEKAVEEWKQTKNERLRNKIAMVYYPFSQADRKKTYNWIKNSKFGMAIASKLRSRYGSDWETYFEDVVLNGWTTSIGNPSKFEDAIARYKVDSPYGIGGSLLTSLAKQVVDLASMSKAQKRGGRLGGANKQDILDLKAEFQDYFDKHNSYPDEYYWRLENLRKDAGARLSSIDSLGTDSEGGRREFNIDGGIEISDKAETVNRMYKLFSDFGNKVSDYFMSKGKESLSVLAKEFFVNGKTYADIISERPDLFEGKKPGDLSIMLLNQVIGAGEVQKMKGTIGLENGFPSSWLDNIMKSKDISSIADALKDVGEDDGSDDEEDYNKKGGEFDDLIFEKFLENNMESILQEVKKRISNS